jgi:oligopeptide/dipeptide ABC transporter ATP-binding protein
MSIQAQIINLLAELKNKFDLTMLFISHDLRVVEYISDRVAVMYLGTIVEEAPATNLFRRPAHPYTEILIKAAPLINPRIRNIGETVKGEIPSPINAPSGCRFHPRCPYAKELCKKEPPIIRYFGGEDHRVACHYPL